MDLGLAQAIAEVREPLSSCSSNEAQFDLFDGEDDVREVDGEKVVINVGVLEACQERRLVVSVGSVYLSDGTDGGKSSSRRRIDIGKLSAITSSNLSDEFLIHVAGENPLVLLSDKKDLIIRCLRRAYKSNTHSKLRLLRVEHEHLKDLQDIPLGSNQDRINAEAVEDNKLDDHENDVRLTELAIDKDVSMDDFIIVRTIGSGSFAKVKLVRSKRNSKLYAAKIFKKSAVIARLQVEHTMTERKFMAIANHPFIVQLRYAFETPEKLCMIFDYYPRGDLFFHLKRKRRFTEKEARFIVAEVVLALGHIHALGHVYRDVKPENVMFGEDWHVALTDFGLTKELGISGRSDTFIGTPEYISPEVLRGGGHGKEVDWWALGILLYELTVGIPPFYSQNVNEMYHKIQHAVLRFPLFLSQECMDLITACLNRNPQARIGAGISDFEEVKAHVFFKAIDWDMLYKKQLEPVYQLASSSLLSDDDTSWFDQTFTNQPLADSPAEPPSQIGGNPFDGFSFLDEAEYDK
eukprot:TRINITY_DN10484_c0_g1_i3.p1 TRINITY_DN10484_c0_g1~~TRINITY_DN10484_c0_g1_i3.p1  ORF type:complete len:521 (+),score=112.32 TRINITY_DN10484_c0_g1_i3:46-1608(+)